MVKPLRARVGVGSCTAMVHMVPNITLYQTSGAFGNRLTPMNFNGPVAPGAYGQPEKRRTPGLSDLMSRGIHTAVGLEQEPGPPFGFIDPDLDQACRGNVTSLFADVVSLS